MIGVRRSECDEELAAIGVRPTIGHAQDASAGMLEARTDLIVKLLAPDGLAATSRARRIAGLKHKVDNDAVEDDVVVVASLCECRKVLACLWTEASVMSQERGIKERGKEG